MQTFNDSSCQTFDPFQNSSKKQTSWTWKLNMILILKLTKTILIWLVGSKP
jgi:hypothetical protein